MLLATGAGATVTLLNNDGRVLHVWRKPYPRTTRRVGSQPFPVPERSIYFRDAQALPGGDIVAIYEGAGDTPWGYGIVKLDKDSNVIWKNLGSFHHTFDFTPNDGVVALSHRIQTEPFEDTVMPVPYIDDEVVWLDGQGRVQQTVSILGAFRHSPYEKLTTRWSEQFFVRGDGDYLHTNDVEYIDTAKAKVLPFAREGDVLISMRSLSMLVGIDPKAKAVRWARGRGSRTRSRRARGRAPAPVRQPGRPRHGRFAGHRVRSADRRTGGSTEAIEIGSFTANCARRVRGCPMETS